MTSNSELHERRHKAVPRGVSNSLAVYAERAANAEIWDVEGRRYIDYGRFHDVEPATLTG